MRNHTPGPWKANGCSIEGPDTPTGRMRSLAVCTPAPMDKDSADRARANARLIAAVPDLLDALKDMVVIAQQDDWHNALTGRQVALEAAEIAIRKAEGRHA